MSASTSTPTAGAATDSTTPPGIYLTVDQLLEDARRALATIAQPDNLEVDTASFDATNPPDDRTIRTIRDVIDKGRRTGRILDSFEERRAAQKELDYLAKILDRFGLAFQETTLVPYSPDAMGELDVPTYPFEDILAQQREHPAPTREVLQDYLWKRLEGANLRCDRALWDNLTSQLGGDPEAWTLLDFTLRRLYADLKRDGVGNKLQWPKGVATDCRTLLAETARQVYESAPRADQDGMRKVLVALGLLARRWQGRGDEPEAYAVELTRNDASAQALAALQAHSIVQFIPAPDGKRRWRLVHRSLQERWGELQRWVDADQMRRRRRLSYVFWTSFAIALCALATVAGMRIYRGQMERADELAGNANVELSKIADLDDEKRHAAETNILRDVRRAYDIAGTPIAYVALFNAVNGIAQTRAPDSARPGRSYLMAFGGKPGDPPIKLNIPPEDPFVPSKVNGIALATAFSPDFERMAIIHSTLEKDAQVWLNIYQWGQVNPLYSEPLCPHDSGRRTVRLSSAGRFFTLECSSATDSIVGAIDPKDQDLIDRMFEATGLDKLAHERFPFFSGLAANEVRMITVSISGDLKVRPLDHRSGRELTFRIPQLAAITPIDTSYDAAHERVAVLDLQGVVSIYGRPGSIARLFHPLEESPALLYINANDKEKSTAGLEWRPVGIEFLPSGTCLRVRRMALDMQSVQNGLLQHYLDDVYIIDPETLLTMADRLARDERVDDTRCIPDTNGR